MELRVFTRDVGHYKVGDVQALEWDSIARSAAQYHGIDGGVESFSMNVEEAAKRYALEHAGGRRTGKTAA